MPDNIAPTTIPFNFSDVSGQQSYECEAPADETMQMAIERLLAETATPRTDAQGRPLTYQARLEREGRHVHASERIGDAIRPGDHLVLQPNIDAGASLG